MGEFEDKLTSILENQDAMGQIMALARSLGGEGKSTQETEKVSEPQTEQRTDAPASSGGMDPRMVELGMKALREFQRQDDRKTALLSDLKPFVRPERYEKLDRAIQVARLSRVIRVLFDAVREGREKGV